MSFGDGASVVKHAGKDFLEDKALTLSAAIAYYTALSLAPMLVIFLWIAGSLGESTKERLIDRIVGVVGEEAGQTVRAVVDNAQENPDAGSIAGILSIAMLVLAATSVFAQLQNAMNIIWDVEARPGQGVMGFVRKRLLSLGMVVTLAFLLLVSLAVSATLSTAMQPVRDSLPGSTIVWQILNAFVSLVVFIPLFAVMFRYLPDVRIAWRDVWVGAAATAVLFIIGKTIVGWYLGRSSTGSAYGAAGSLVTLLLWVYYSAIILFFGAELTQAWAQHAGRRIEPDRHAQRTARGKAARAAG